MTQPTNSQLAAWAAEKMGLDDVEHFNPRPDIPCVCCSAPPSDKGFCPDRFDPAAPGADFWRFWDWLVEQGENPVIEVVQGHHNAGLARQRMLFSAVDPNPRRALLLAWAKAEGLTE